MGSGKTLLMTIIGELFFKNGIPLYANYKLKNAIEITTRKQLKEIGKGVICLDEFWGDLDSRDPKNNKELTRWINQTRKKNILAIYTTQHFKQIDLRARRATNLVIYCERHKKAAEPYFRYTFMTNTGTMLTTFKITEEKCKQFYEYYNTYEIINTLESTHHGRRGYTTGQKEG